MWTVSVFGAGVTGVVKTDIVPALYSEGSHESF